MTAKRRPAISVLAYGLAALTLASSAATLGLAIANRSTINDITNADPISIILPIGFAVVGALVASRLRHNATGWLFLMVGLITALIGVADQYARFALITAPGSLPGAVWALWLNTSAYTLVYPAGSAVMLMLLLPDGRLPSRSWRPVAVGAVLLTAILAIPISALAPAPLTVTGTSTPALVNPLGVSALQIVSSQGALVGVAFGLFIVGLALVVVAGAAPFLRMRRARGEERQQLKWIAYAILISAVVSSPLTVLSGPNAPLPSWSADLAIGLGFGVALPVAAGVAIFKHRLYDIDVVISRTLVYGALAAFITVVYVGIAVGIGALIGGGGKPNLGLSILATAIVAIGFQPVRERMQKVANRLVYGKRATPYEVLSAFSGRVGDAYAAEDVLLRMSRVLKEGTASDAATVWLRRGDQLRPEATYPDTGKGYEPIPMSDGVLPALPGVTRSISVRHHDDLLGALSVVKRRGESLTPIEEKLLEDLAQQAGLVFKNVGLTAELMQRVDDIRISRQRVVRAQDEARKRLERNLHDGAQQHLVALKVKLGLVEVLTAKDPARATLMLEELQGDADDALETLRDLARGIYPPLLADMGLVAALESQARKSALPVSVEASATSRYPREIEAAVYFCVLEALQNIQKYAKASKVVIRLDETDGALHFEVEDDGQGFDVATAKRGAGLTNIGDRLEALGGSVDIASTQGKGVRINGTLPLATVAA